MAQQIINIGNAANDGSGDGIRTGGQKANDNFTELYNAVATLNGSLITAASLVRSQLSEACNGTVGQVIPFSSQFVNVYALSILDYNGVGIGVTAQDEDGFTITSLGVGNFGYIALIEV
jgi:hypothetical protein